MPTGNPRFLIDNVLDRATWTAVPALQTGFPVENLQRQERGDLASTTSTASQQYKFVLGVNTIMNMLFLWYVNLTAAAIIRLQLYSDAAWTTLIYDSTAVSAWPYTGFSASMNIMARKFKIFKTVRLYFAQQNNVQSGIITITDPNNPAGQFDISRAGGGKYWEFQRGLPYNASSHKIGNLTKGGRAKSGGWSADAGENFLNLEFRPEWLSQQTDWPELMAMLVMRGGDEDIFVSQYPEDGTHVEAMHHGMVMLPDSAALQRPMFQMLSTALVFNGK